MKFDFDTESWLTRKPKKSLLRSKYLKQVAEEIKDGGQSNHSGQGTSLFVLLHYLEINKISYSLEAHPGLGYVIKGMEKIDI